MWKNGWSISLSRVILTCSVFFLLTASGCGYHLGHGVGNQAGSTLDINIPMFENKTSEPKLGLLVTRGVKDAMLKTPGIQVVNNAQGADIVIRGRIVQYRVPTTAFDRRATTEEDVELSVIIQVEDPIQKKSLWRDTIKSSAAFYLGPDLTLNRSAQDRATEEASTSFASILIGQLLDRYEAQQRRDKKKNNTKN